MRLALAILLALPVFGAAQELWHFGSPNLIYGIYRKKWHDAVYFDEVRIGHIDTTLKDTQWNGIPCKLYTSNSFFSPKEGMPAIPTARITKSYIGADGKVLRVETSYSDWQKSVIVVADFKVDEIELFVRDKNGERRSTLNPAGGTGTFRNPFLALIAEMEKDRKDVKFQLIDPASGGLISYTARAVGKFNGTISNEKFQGAIVELNGPLGRDKVWITDKGMMIKVELHDGAVVNAQDFPFKIDG
ncbi:MAG: hypothetical protein L6Q31_02425 [Fimbriimonadaceae bacterium]|nr:hypothetical protein [Fimbriimonadaceae bacterium]NUM37514.1 hypothetical protein [Armatimonadota bacterium]